MKLVSFLRLLPPSKVAKRGWGQGWGGGSGWGGHSVSKDFVFEHLRQSVKEDQKCCSNRHISVLIFLFQGGGRGGYHHSGPAWKRRKGESEDTILKVWKKASQIFG